MALNNRKYKVLGGSVYDDWASDRTWSVVDAKNGDEICKCDNLEYAQEICNILNNLSKK